MKPSVTYSSRSDLKDPAAFLAGIFRDLAAARPLALRLMMRDLKARYRQTFLGVAWLFVPPLALAATMVAARDAGVVDVGPTPLPYAAYVMISTALWQTFVESVSGPVQAVTDSRHLLARVRFPREAIVLARLGEVMVNFAVKLLLIGGVFVAYRIEVDWGLVLAPFAVASLVLLGTFFGVLLAPIGVLTQDVAKGLPVAMGFWLLLTPVIYPVPTAGPFATVVALNPVTPLLVSARELATASSLSSPVALVAVSAAVLVALFLTWGAYRLAMPYVIERVGA